MSNNDSDNTSSPATGLAGDAALLRYLAVPFEAHMVSGNNVLLFVDDGRPIQKLPLQAAQTLGACDRFRTLEEHVSQVARSLQIPETALGSVHQTLEDLVQRELLQSEPQALARLRSPADDASPSGIESLFIRTCGRPGTLERLLQSLIDRQCPQSLKHCIVLDDDRNPSTQEITQQIISRFQPQFEGRLKLINDRKRRALLEHIARETGSDCKQLKWYLEGDPTSHESTYGCGFNLAILLGAGMRMALMDDDVTFQTHALPGCRDQPVLKRSQSLRLHFPEPHWELPGSHYPAIDDHPLSLHADMLGSKIGRLAAVGKQEIGALLKDLDPHFLSEVNGRSHIRLTTSGTLGDPGTQDMHWLFAENPLHLQPLCESEQRYHQLISQRQLARCADSPQATTDYGLMTGGMSGIDNRAFLLPTQPNGRGEDLLFGALVKYLDPGTVQVNLPHMLYHMPAETRSGQAMELDRPRCIDQSQFLTEKIELHGKQLPGFDTESRVEALRGFLRALARTGKSSLAGQLRRELLVSRASMAERISATRDGLKPPNWLDRDFVRLIDCHSQTSEEDEARIQQLTVTLPGFLEHYADGFPAWQAAWHFCRAHGITWLLDQVGE